MAIKSKVFVQSLQKTKDRLKISFAFEFNNKNSKKVFGANLPPPNTIKLDLSPNTIRVKFKDYYYLSKQIWANLIIKQRTIWHGLSLYEHTVHSYSIHKQLK